MRTHNLLEYLPLVKKSVIDLVVTLYQDKSLLSLQRDDFDLHLIINELGKRYGMELEKVRLMILQKWLTKEIDYDSDQKRIYLPSTRFQLTNLNESETTIQRKILYLMSCKQFQKDGMDILLNFAYQPNSKIQTMSRVRALAILLELVKDESRIKLSDIKNYMKMLLYLGDFEDLRIVQSLKEFNECNKLSLVRSLWLHHRDNIKAIHLMCNICLDYDIYDGIIWENILSGLFHLHSQPHSFGYILERISLHLNVSLKPLNTLWNTVLDADHMYLALKPIDLVQGHSSLSNQLLNHYSSGKLNLVSTLKAMALLGPCMYESLDVFSCFKILTH